MSDEMGWMIAEIWAQLCDSSKNILRHGMEGATDDQINDLIRDAQKELTRNNYHAYYIMCTFHLSGTNKRTVVCAQRP
jgi:hypothetical protein